MVVEGFGQVHELHLTLASTTAAIFLYHEVLDTLLNKVLDMEFLEFPPCSWAFVGVRTRDNEVRVCFTLGDVLGNAHLRFIRPGVLVPNRGLTDGGTLRPILEKLNESNPEEWWL